MDFGTLLHVAKRNNEQLDKNAEGSKYYSTKFSAPKKESKEKKLSDNIKKFLAKREQEEREKARIEKQKRDELLALRDQKAKNKIKKMLKVIKSANKSVLEDAVDNQDTALTLQGPEQPDEDDYGYVSQEASAFYQKYMDKVKSIPEENKFAPSRPMSRTDLAGTKDRVRAAIQKEQEEVSTGSRSTKSSTKSSESSAVSSTSSSTMPGETHRRKNLYDPQLEREIEEKKKREEEQKKIKNRKPAPPPINFQQLIKLAEKKQFEPVEIVVETKKEPERLLTKREKQELEERRQYLQEREQRKKDKMHGVSSGGGSSATSGGGSGANKMQPNGRIPKLNGSTTASSSSIDKNSKAPSSKSNTSATSLPPPARDLFKKPVSSSPQLSSKTESISSKSTKIESKINSSTSLKSKYPPPSPSSSAKSSSSLTSTTNQSRSTLSAKPQSKPISKPTSALQSSSSSSSQKPQAKQPYNGPTREFPPKDPSRTKQSQLQNGRGGESKPISKDIQRTRQFPPPDVRAGPRPKKQQQAIKRRIYDDDSEYDSELDDFIDDGPEEEENYSSYIKEIFGYDKSRYRDIDDDDRGMESNFAQQMKEEFVSKKIGLMEDLEDMRLEAEEKKRKAVKKRKLK